MKNFMRIGDVARELKLSVSTVRRCANEGKLDYETTPAGQRVLPKAKLINFWASKDLKSLCSMFGPLRVPEPQWTTRRIHSVKSMVNP